MGGGGVGEDSALFTSARMRAGQVVDIDFGEFAHNWSLVPGRDKGRSPVKCRMFQGQRYVREFFEKGATASQGGVGGPSLAEGQLGADLCCNTWLKGQAVGCALVIGGQDVVAEGAGLAGGRKVRLML